MKTSIVIRIQGPALTALTFVPAAGPFVTPVASGTVFGHLSVEPADWPGDLTVGGPDAEHFSVSPAMEIMAARELDEAREYDIDVGSA